MRKKSINVLVLIVIIGICLFRITYLFANYRESFHCDEPWSYGFANSEYDPFIYSDNHNIKDSFSNVKNVYSWVSGDTFKNYLEVNDGERFHFKSVIYNKSEDMSPPLFELLLHFICSFFPNTFSWWYAYVINAFCLIVILVLLYRICSLLQTRPLISLIITLFYGLSLGSFYTTVYLRMYALLTMFMLATVLIFQKIIISEKNSFIYNIFLILMVFFGSFSHFYYLLFGFFFTGCVCLFLLFKKNIGKALNIGLTMLSGVGLYFAIYSPSIKMILGSDTMYEDALTYPYKICLDICLNYLSVATIGTRWLLDRFLLLYLLAIFIFVVIISALLLFLLRNESYFEKILLFYKSVIYTLGETGKKIVYYFADIKRIIIIPCWLSVIATVFAIAKVSNISMMGTYCDRYLFYLYPVFIFSIAIPLFDIFGKNNKIQLLYSICLIFILASSIWWQNNGITHSKYLFNTGENKTDLGELFTDSNVIVITDNISRIEWYSVYLINCKNAFFYSHSDKEYATELLADFNEDAPLYIVIESTDESKLMGYPSDDEMLNSLKDCNEFFKEPLYSFTQNTYFGDISIYSINN